MNFCMFIIVISHMLIPKNPTKNHIKNLIKHNSTTLYEEQPY